MIGLLVMLFFVASSLSKTVSLKVGAGASPTFMPTLQPSGMRLRVGSGQRHNPAKRDRPMPTSDPTTFPLKLRALKLKLRMLKLRVMPSHTPMPTIEPEDPPMRDISHNPTIRPDKLKLRGPGDHTHDPTGGLPLKLRALKLKTRALKLRMLKLRVVPSHTPMPTIVPEELKLRGPGDHTSDPGTIPLKLKGPGDHTHEPFP